MSRTRSDAPTDSSPTAAVRTWGDDVLAELPPMVEALLRNGAPGLSMDDCARALVLAGRARQLGASDPALDALAAQIEPLVASLLARAPLDDAHTLFERTDAALTQENPLTTDPLDALLACDDWFTAFGFGRRAGLSFKDDPVALSGSLGALISALPEVLAGLGPFAVARAAGLTQRARETPAWDALLELWDAVAEAPIFEELLQTFGASVAEETVEDRWRLLAPPTAQAPDRPMVDIAPYFEPRAAALGVGLLRRPDPVEIVQYGDARVVQYGDARVVVACAEHGRTGPILHVSGIPPSTRLEIWRDGVELPTEVDEFSARVADARPGQHTLLIGDDTWQFTLTGPTKDR